MAMQSPAAGGAGANPYASMANPAMGMSNPYMSMMSPYGTSNPYMNMMSPYGASNPYMNMMSPYGMSNPYMGMMNPYSNMMGSIPYPVYIPVQQQAAPVQVRSQRVDFGLGGILSRLVGGIFGRA